MKGIIFSPRKVAAMLADPDREWQTRRLVKPQPTHVWGQGEFQCDVSADGQQVKRGEFTLHCRIDNCKDVYLYPRYRKGETLYVKESWRLTPGELIGGETISIDHKDSTTRVLPFPYKQQWRDFEPRWRHRMPEWASRLTITITSVRVERVNQISDDDIEAEGISAIEVCSAPCCPCGARTECTHYKSFRDLWNSINPRHPFDSGPWVWVYTYKVALK